MINFFRKTRKKLADDNKPMKYMRYAIGEIALVVVGILIALQINNWKIDQFEKKEEINYLNRLLQDLKNNLTEIERILVLDQRRLYQCNVTLNDMGSNNISFHRNRWQFRNKEFNIDTIKILNQTFGFGLTAIRYYNKFNNSDATYLELIANGKIDLIRDEQLKISVIAYYSTLEDKLQIPNMIEMMRHKYVDMLADQGISTYNNKMSFNEFENKVDNKDNIIAAIENIFGFSRGSQGILKYNDQSIEMVTEELITKIENYLD
jgi:hypothetical protein